VKKLSTKRKSPKSTAIARKQLLRKLASYGMLWDRDQQRLVVADLRDTQRKLATITNGGGKQYEKYSSPYFAKSNEIDILRIDPVIVPVTSEDRHISRIWSYALTFWSVPVSAGYGRRLRFLVVDQQNGKLMGLFGLCDPMIGSKIRDGFIGWNKEQKHERLYNCMTAYILGAVPPYNKVLGSKLIALATMFPEVREEFHQKYLHNRTTIAGKEKEPYLAMIDTYGAFQKSAIYTRLLNWRFIGYTQGQSHLHITANGSWELIKQFVPDEQFRSYSYGQGSNWKLRTLKIGLANLGLQEEILTTGWRRAYYVCPLLTNFHEYMTMAHKLPKFVQHSASDLVMYWKEHWIKPRIDKLKEHLFHK
jgi:hypothetical protein